MQNLIFILIFITITLIIYTISTYSAYNQKSISRLNKYFRTEEIKQKDTNKKQKNRSALDIMARGIKEISFLDSYKKKIQSDLSLAHILLKPEEYIIICLLLFSGIGFLTFLITDKSSLAIFFSLITGSVGWIIPKIVVQSKIRKRIRRLNDQLGDTVLLISNSLKAGFSFFQAIDAVSVEMKGPIAEEFALLQKEINLGSTTEKALENLIARIPSRDLELVVTAVLIQRQIGGNLSEILDNISFTIKERIRIKGEIRTVTAQGRISGLIISFLPVGLFLTLYVINPSYMSLLFTEPLGIVIIVFAVIMEFLGIFAIKKIVTIEV
jgi:tight adherence protein B